MRKIFLLLVLFCYTQSFSQRLNDYKYVIVPSQFDFTNKPDAYRLNSTTKSLLEHYGFVVFLDTENLPIELVDSNCNKLYADVKSEGTFLKTKLVLYLSDCQKNVLYSAKGENREKEYGTSYNLAIREIGKAMSTLNYKYNGKSEHKTLIQSTNVSPASASAIAGKEMLFAQPTANGFQLVDNTPKVVMRIYNTSVAEVFIAEKNQVKGTLSKKNGVWNFEYYTGENLVTESLNIKF